MVNINFQSCVGILLSLSFLSCTVDDIVVPDNERLVPEDYLPFAEEGKVWVYAGEKVNNIIPTELYRYLIKGDTLLSGKQYKKMYLLESASVTEGQYRYIGAVRDSLMKVLFIDSSKRKERLIYDFGLQDGNQMRWCGYTLMAGDAYQKVVHGSTRRVLPVCSSNHAFNDTWIEGIGCASGGWYTSFDPILKRKSVLMKCNYSEGCCYDYETDNELYE